MFKQSFCLLFASFLVTVSPLQAQEYRIAIPQATIQRLNSVWEKLGRDYKLLSQSISCNLSENGKISSISGHFLMRCEEGHNVSVNIIFPDLNLIAESEVEGLRPAGFEHAVAFIASNEETQFVMLTEVIGLLAIPFRETENDKGEMDDRYFVLSLYLSQNEGMYRIIHKIVDARRFREIK